MNHHDSTIPESYGFPLHAVGDRVYHPRYGGGTVTAVKSAASACGRYRVLFDDKAKRAAANRQPDGLFVGVCHNDGRQTFATEPDGERRQRKVYDNGHGIVWSLQQHPAIHGTGVENQQYHGCGCGWIEVTPQHDIVKMRYSHRLNDEGSESQNTYCSDNGVVYLDDCDDTYLTDKPGEERQMPNGNRRIFVNFSCWSACEF